MKYQTTIFFAFQMCIYTYQIVRTRFCEVYEVNNQNFTIVLNKRIQRFSFIFICFVFLYTNKSANFIIVSFLKWKNSLNNCCTKSMWLLLIVKFDYKQIDISVMYSRWVFETYDGSIGIHKTNRNPKWWRDGPRTEDYITSAKNLNINFTFAINYWSLKDYENY
jgi:hypothetical protein